MGAVFPLHTDSAESVSDDPDEAVDGSLNRPSHAGMTDNLVGVVDSEGSAPLVPQFSEIPHPVCGVPNEPVVLPADDVASVIQIVRLSAARGYLFAQIAKTSACAPDEGRVPRGG